MLDDATRDRCARVAEMAYQDGMNLWEAMDKASLLLTDDRRKLSEQAILSLLLVRLEDQQPTALAHLGGGQTVTGAVNGVIEFLKIFITGWGKR